MCYSCWTEAGQPTIDNPVVRAAAKAMEKVYEYHGAGGRLHILLDDWNVENEHIASIEKDMAERLADTPEQDTAERFCLGLFKSLSEEERLSALGLQEGFWGGEFAS